MTIARICCIAAATAALGGCTLLAPMPAVKVDRYCIDTGGTNILAKAPLRIAVQQVEGRDQYRRDKMVFSTTPYVLDSYQNSVWAQNPCDMLFDEMVTFFSRKFQYATTMPRVYKTPVDTVVIVYIDAFDQACREERWQAVLRVKYELMSGDGTTLLLGSWFERTVMLKGKGLEQYVAVQNASVRELFVELEKEIVLHVRPAPAAKQ